MPTRFFQSEPLPQLGRAVGIVHVQRGGNLNEATAYAFFARRQQKIEEAKVEAGVDPAHPPGVLVDAILDKVKHRMMGVMEEEMEGQVYAACIPLELRESAPAEIRAIRYGNSYDAGHASLHLDRIEDDIEARNPS